jgi:hypothetical protein
VRPPKHLPRSILLRRPHFAPGDFETRADLIPFVEGVSNLVLPAGTPSLFTELNEFDEGCSAIKSLAVRVCFFSLLRSFFFSCVSQLTFCSLRPFLSCIQILAAHCSTE